MSRLRKWWTHYDHCPTCQGGSNCAEGRDLEDAVAGLHGGRAV
jgi:hypothetical protein